MSNKQYLQNNHEMGTAVMDWHRADIIAALKKRGTNVTALSRENGLASSTLSNTLRSPWPKGEQIIADAIGVKPEVIWPSRYHQVKKAS